MSATDVFDLLKIPAWNGMLLLFAVDSVTFTSCVIRSTWLLRSDRHLRGRTLKISRTSLAAKLGSLPATSTAKALLNERVSGLSMCRTLKEARGACPVQLCDAVALVQQSFLFLDSRMLLRQAQSYLQCSKVPSTSTERQVSRTWLSQGSAGEHGGKSLFCLSRCGRSSLVTHRSQVHE